MTTPPDKCPHCGADDIATGEYLCGLRANHSDGKWWWPEYRVNQCLLNENASLREENENLKKENADVHVQITCLLDHFERTKVFNNGWKP